MVACCVSHCYLSSPFIDSDITALAKDRTYAHINLDEMTVLQVSFVFKFPAYIVLSERDHNCVIVSPLACNLVRKFG